MAIVKMKRLRLLGMQSDRDSLFRHLQKLGCVEISEPAIDLTDPDWAALTKPEGRDLAAAKEQSNLFGSALETLKKYAPAKGGLFIKRTELSDSELFDEAVYAEGLEAAHAILDGERNVAALLAEQNKLEGQKLALAPWLALDIPMELENTAHTSLVYGTVPTRADFAAMEAAVTETTELSALFQSGEDNGLRYFLLVCHNSVESECCEAMRPFGFSRVSLRGWTGTAADNDRLLDNRLNALEKELEETREAIAAQAPHRDALLLCVDRTTQDVSREENIGRLIDTDTAFFLDGWFPADSEDKLGELLGSYTCAWETEEPASDDYPEVPVKLKNNWLTGPLSMVTEMYSLPAYGTVDPNPLMAPFFILFYGIMLADMGYGLLMIIAGLFVSKKFRPKGTMGHMFNLATLCGIATFIVGAITGGFFGDFLTQVVKILFNKDFALPALFTPLDDTLMILIGSLALGFVHIVTGMAVSFVQKIKAGEIMDAIWEEVTWWVVFVGLALMVLGVTPIVLAVGGVMIVVGAGWTAKGFGKVTAIFGSLYNHVTGFFGDILSYSRLMALMLAGSVIAQVFNTLGAIPGNIIIFLVISLVGNALNFALNLLGCYVHDLRLQCLEFFGKFYTDGGRPFKPLAFNTKYTDVINKKN